MNQVEEAFCQYWRHLTNYAYRVLENSHEAEDVAQEVFATWIRLGLTLRNPPAWLFRLVRNRCYDIIRRRQRDEERLYTFADAWERAKRVPVPDTTETVVEEAGAMCIAATLSPRQRECIQLRAEGYGDEEIARAWGVKPGAIRRYRWDARQKLERKGIA